MTTILKIEDYDCMTVSTNIWRASYPPFYRLGKLRPREQKPQVGGRGRSCAPGLQHTLTQSLMVTLSWPPSDLSTYWPYLVFAPSFL